MHHTLSAQLQQLGVSQDVAPSNAAWQAMLERVNAVYEESEFRPEFSANDEHTIGSTAAINEKIPILEPLRKAGVSFSAQLLAAADDTFLLLDADMQVKACHKLELLQDPNLSMPGDTVQVSELPALLGAYVFKQLKRAVIHCLASSDNVDFEFRLPSAAGFRSFQVLVLPPRTDVQPLATVVISDSTTIDELRDAHAMYSSLLDLSSEGLVLLNSSMEAIYVNKAFLSISGNKPEGLSVESGLVFTDINGDSLDQEIWKKVCFHQTWDGEVYFEHRSGLRVSARLCVEPIGDEGCDDIQYLISCIDITRYKAAEQELEKSVSFDRLTGLPNRSHFRTSLSKAIYHAQQESNSGALFFIDLDKFKAINESLGHGVGDVLLMAIANRLQHFTRDGEVVSRISGDEFTIIVENLHSADDAAAVAQRLQKEFELPVDVEGHEIDVTCSIGISMFPQDGNDCDAIIRHAGTAMHSAKLESRNSYKLYTKRLTHEAVQSFSIETQLRRAIDRNELFLTYQPQVDMKRRQLTGAEVLLRWDNAEHGIISPALFIPIAEETGLIEVVGDWVLDRACFQIDSWRKFSTVPCPLAVNVSRRQLMQKNFVRTVESAMQSHGVSGNELEIEVTESALVGSESTAIANLNGLRELGCKISIDDFGTGYSSLSSLMKFPLDRLKIDKSFVMDMGVDSNADAICAAVIALAKSLGLGVIAEGVETQQQVKALLKKGCREAQGFFYCKPLIASEFRAYDVKATLSRNKKSS